MAHIYEKAYFGDRIVPISEARLSVASAAVLYGLSVYSVFPVFPFKDGFAAFRLSEHYKRLVDSARIIGIDTFESSWSYAKFESAVTELIKVSDIKESVFVRATVHVDEMVPGTRSRGLKTTLSMFVYESKPIVPQDGARLKISSWRRVPDISIPARAKVNGAYVNSVLAKQEALDCGYDDCIFLDANGHVCELSAANIFMVRDGVLITPGNMNDILEGINRRTVIELARDLNIPVVERNIDLTELYVADEIFASGTSSMIAFVKEIDKRVIGKGVIGPITAILREKYGHILRGEAEAYSKYLTILGL
jgi:branched-chain amino acid aminotransferase